MISTSVAPANAARFHRAPQSNPSRRQNPLLRPCTCRQVTGRCATCRLWSLRLRLAELIDATSGVI